jgi:hypothetical protein
MTRTLQALSFENRASGGNTGISEALEEMVGDTGIEPVASSV